MRGKATRKSKVLLGLCCILLLTILTAGCSGGNSGSGNTSDGNSGSSSKNDGNSADPAVAQGKPVKIDMLVAPAATIVDLKTNAFTTLAEKQFNIKFDFNIVPGSDRDTKQSLLMASGDYPSVFWSGNFSTTDLQKYGKQGTLIPLNDLIDKYAPNVKAGIDNEPGVKGITESPDGNIYGLPSVNWCLHCYYSAKMWVNTKLLDKFNLQMPTTTEEFKHVLQVFKDNGIIPLTGVTDGWNSDPTVFLMNAFTYDDATNYYQVDDGQVSFAPVKEGWKKGLAYIKDLYANGLLDKQALSQKNDNLIRLAAQDKVGFIPWGVSNGFIPNGSADPNYKYWRTIPPLKGPDGTQLATFFGNGYGSASFAITDKATPEQQKAIMTFINYIWTEDGTQTLDFGPEGEFWKKAKPDDIGLDGKPALYDTAWNSFYAAGAKVTSGWDQMGPIFQSKKWRDGGKAIAPFSNDGLSTLLQLETMKDYAGLQPPQVYPGAAWVPEADTSTFSMLRTNINKFVKQSTAEFIIGTKDPEKDWDAYVKGLNNLGLKQYLDISQKAMIHPFDTADFKKDQASLDFLTSIK